MIGTEFFARFADREGLMMLTNGPPRGLVENFTALAGPACDPSQVDAQVAEFYKQTSEFEFDVWSEWRGGFRPSFNSSTPRGRRTADRLGQGDRREQTHVVRRQLLPLPGARIRRALRPSCVSSTERKRQRHHAARGHVGRQLHREILGEEFRRPRVLFFRRGRAGLGTILESAEETHPCVRRSTRPPSCRPQSPDLGCDVSPAALSNTAENYLIL